MIGEPGSLMQKEFDRDQALADQYWAEANVKDLHALYVKRCKQLEEFGETLSTMAEMYAGKSSGRGDFARSSASPDAVASMERVAIAAIALAQSVVDKMEKA